MIRYILAAVAMACSMPLSAQERPDQTVAPSLEQIEIARQIVQRARVREQLQQSMLRTQPLLVSTFLGELSRTPDGRLALATIERYFAGGPEAFSEQFSARFTARFESFYPEMLEATARYFAERLTEDHLRAALAFMDSDAGEAWARVVRESEDRIGNLGEQFGARSGTEIGEEMFDELQALIDSTPGE